MWVFKKCRLRSAGRSLDFGLCGGVLLFVEFVGFVGFSFVVFVEWFYF